MTRDELLLFGERLRRRRNELGITQESVSDKVNISLRFYQMIERGEKSLSLDTLIGLSKTLNVSIDFLLFGDLSCTLDNPIADIISGLPSDQRNDALKILELYAKSCGRFQTTLSGDPK